jgi:hypothetical protein
MGVLMIRCPNTGRDISTGIETDAASFSQVGDVLAHSRCPLCGLEHAWWKREAWLSEPSGANSERKQKVARYRARAAAAGGATTR